MNSRNLLQPLMAGLALGSFTLLSVRGDWPAVVGFALVLGFVGFVLWLNPEKKHEVKREDFDKLVERLNEVEQRHKNLSAKIGFNPTR